MFFQIINEDTVKNGI